MCVGGSGWIMSGRGRFISYEEAVDSDALSRN